MIHLESVVLKNRQKLGEGYPFTLPLVENFGTLTFRSPVTFFVGENGSGKSTILEAIAAGVGAPTVGGTDIKDDPTLASIRQLGRHLTLVWRKRTHRGFFMRAEDFFNFATRTRSLVRDLEDMAAAFEEDLTGEGLSRARGAVLGQRAALVKSYGVDLHARSHGESFLTVFQSRFVPGGLYLLDEPDTALSPRRQLALIALLKDMVRQDGQFIIATHSPIVLAFPEAAILAFDGKTIKPIPYDSVDSVMLTRDFLSNTEAFVRRL